MHFKCFLFGGDITFALPTCELLGVIPPMSCWRTAVTSLCFSFLYLKPRAVCWASRSSLSHQLTEDAECCMVLIWIWDKIKEKIKWSASDDDFSLTSFGSESQLSFFTIIACLQLFLPTFWVFPLTYNVWRGHKPLKLEVLVAARHIRLGKRKPPNTPLQIQILHFNNSSAFDKSLRGGNKGGRYVYRWGAGTHLVIVG